MAVLQRSDTLQLSESGRGRVSFQNGRKHIVISFRTDLQGVTETGRAGTESREPTYGPARSPSARRQEGRHHRPLTHGNKKPGSNTHRGPHRSAATGSLPARRGKTSGGSKERSDRLPSPREGRGDGETNAPWSPDQDNATETGPPHFQNAPGGKTSGGSKERSDRLPSPREGRGDG